MANSRGYVYEHRLIAADTLGRPLTATEVVDHVDGDTSNNDPVNLRVHSSQAEHAAQHAALRRGETT